MIEPSPQKGLGSLLNKVVALQLINFSQMTQKATDVFIYVHP